MKILNYEQEKKGMKYDPFTTRPKRTIRKQKPKAASGKKAYLAAEKLIENAINDGEMF